MATELVEHECQAGASRAWGTDNILRLSNPGGIRISGEKMHGSL